MTAASDLTILLTLKDRVPFTDRWMRYMDDQRCPYAILIADGGTDAELERRLRQPDRYPNLTFAYVRYPPDVDHQAFYGKFADAVERVSTPYVLLADNDDFVVLDHIPAFLDVLDRHPEVVSCGGTRTVLRLLAEDGALVTAPAARRYDATLDARPKSVVAASGADRLCYFLTHVQRQYLWSTWYQVHRTASVLRAAAGARGRSFADPVAFEMHLHMFLLWDGQYRQCDAPLQVVQAGTSQLTAALDAGGNLVERFVASGAFADLQRSLESAAGTLSEADRRRVAAAMAQWLAEVSGRLYPAMSPAGAADPMERAYRLFRRMLRPFKSLQWNTTRRSSSVRLPAIEPYILE